MTAPDSEPCDIDTTRPRRPGAVFLVCGLVFLGVGAATRQAAFLALGPAFLVLGIALLARARTPSR
jgi:uncharacterized membrane protein HdeD (DUF308 family)